MAAIGDRMDHFAHSVIASKQARSNAVADGKTQTAAMLSGFFWDRTRMVADLARELFKDHHERIQAWHHQAAAISRMRQEHRRSRAHAANAQRKDIANNCQTRATDVANLVRNLRRSRKVNANAWDKSLSEFAHTIQADVCGLLTEARSARRTMAHDTAQQVDNAVAAARHCVKEIEASTQQLLDSARRERRTMAGDMTRLMIFRKQNRHQDVASMLERFRAFRKDLREDFEVAHRAWGGVSSARSHTRHAVPASSFRTFLGTPAQSHQGTAAAGGETAAGEAARGADVKNPAQSKKKHAR